jgi:hypothetical protein
MSEWAKRTGGLAAIARPGRIGKETGRRADHRMPPAPDVDPFDGAVEIGVHIEQVVAHDRCHSRSGRVIMILRASSGFSFDSGKYQVSTVGLPSLASL